MTRDDKAPGQGDTLEHSNRALSVEFKNPAATVAAKMVMMFTSGKFIARAVVRQMHRDNVSLALETIKIAVDGSQTKAFVFKASAFQYFLGCKRARGVLEHP